MSVSPASITQQIPAQLGLYMSLQHDSAKRPWISSLKSVSSSAQQELLVDTGRGRNLPVIGQFGLALGWDGDFQGLVKGFPLGVNGHVED